MGKIKGFLFAVRHREILMTDWGLKSGLAEESNLAICCLLGNPATDATINPEKKQ